MSRYHREGVTIWPIKAQKILNLMNSHRNINQDHDKLPPCNPLIGKDVGA